MPDFKLKSPAPHFANAEEAAAKLGISERRLRQLAEAFPAIRDRHGQYDLRELAKMVKKKKARELLKASEPAASPSSTDADPTFNEAKKRKTLAEAGRQELRLARERGELIPVALYRQALIDKFIMVRERMLTLPSIAYELVGLSIEEMEARIDVRVRERLESLSNGELVHATADPGALPEHPSDGSGSGAGPGPASDAESVGVGGPAPHPAQG